MIHVLTPTIRGREHQLRQCVTSVVEQTYPRVQHHVMLDADRLGPAKIRNWLAMPYNRPDQWITFLDDDDLWDSDHLTQLNLDHRGSAEVVYSLARIEGRPGWDPQLDHFDLDRMLNGSNYIPLCGVAVRADLFHRVGGFPEDGRKYEDHGFLQALARATQAWSCLPIKTWTYRFGEWDSRSKEIWRGER